MARITSTLPRKSASQERSKLMVELALRDYSNASGLRSVSLRYFNACGADPSGEIGEDHYPETHLIPLVLQVALGLGVGWVASRVSLAAGFGVIAAIYAIAFGSACWPVRAGKAVAATAE